MIDPTDELTEQPDEVAEEIETDLVAADLIEEVSIDGMCGVY